VEEIKHLLF